MVVKSSPRSRRCVILLAVLALLVCVGVDAKATDSNTAKPLREIQGKRSLRTFIETTEDDDSEERAISDAVKKVASKLSSSNQDTTSKLFKSLEVEKTGEKLFRSKNFKEWATSVTKHFNQNTQLAEVAMVSTLASHYGDDALAKLLVTAKSNYKSRTVATQLESAQFQAWESAGKSADDVFNLLKLDDKGEKLFESPVVTTWVSYVSKLNTKNSDEVVYASLKKLFDDEALAKMIAGAKNTMSTNPTANKLEQVQISKWVDEGKSADDVFKFLKLNKEGENLLQSPVLGTWISFVKLQGKDPYETVLLKLAAHYDDAALATVLTTAKQSGKTSSIAGKLQEVQFKNWQSEGKTTDDIFKLLTLNQAGDDILASPMLSTWRSYLASTSKGNADEVMLVQLQKYYDDAGLAAMIAKAKTSTSSKSIATKLQEEIWRSEGKTASDVFKLLQLKNSGKNIFETSELSTWVSYVTKLNSLSKKPDDFLVISELEKQFTTIGLARMLGEAKYQASLTSGDGAAKTLAGTLETLQFKKWLAAGSTPKAITNQFTSLVIVPSDTRVLLAYSDFYKLNAGKVTA